MTTYEIRKRNLAILRDARKVGDWETVRLVQSDLQKDWDSYWQAKPTIGKN